MFRWCSVRVEREINCQKQCVELLQDWGEGIASMITDLVKGKDSIGISPQSPRDLDKARGFKDE